MIVVRTAPRETDYLPRTLLLLEQAGAFRASEERYVWTDGRRIEVSSDWTVIGTPDVCQGARESGWALFRWLVERQVPWAIICEDDIIPCKNALDFAAQLAVPDDCTCLSFFDCRELAPEQPALIIRPALTYAYSQMVKFPLRTLKYLAAIDHRVQQHPDPNGYDPGMRCFLASQPGAKYATLFPNIVEHAGKVSAARTVHKGPIKSRTFPGEDFDALSLSGVTRTEITTF